MENDNSSALTPMAGMVSKLQEDCASKRLSKVVRDGLGFCGGGGCLNLHPCSLFWHQEASLG